MYKTLGLISIFALVSANAYAQDCEAYKEEAEAISGVVPRFNEDGTLKSLLTHGESTFISANNSLIASAKQNAELKAKGYFSKFLNEEISAESIAESTLEQSELTDESGNTEGYANELKRYIELMRSNSTATLKGLVKLDECVDPNEKIVMVTFGWKPEFLNEENSTEISQENSQTEKESTQDNASGGISIIKLDVTGYGIDQNQAIADGLRIAVGQVFGEIIASSMFSESDTTSSVESTADGQIKEDIQSDSTTQSSYVSATSGIIDSYRIVSIDSNDNQYVVDMEVKLPKYELDSSTDGKKKIIVFQPKIIASESVSLDDSVAKQIQRELESILNETNALTALNREDAREQNYELSNIWGVDFDNTEAAKLGNRLGADFLVITEFSKFESREDVIKIGNKKSPVINVMEANAWIKVIDVATTNSVVSIRVPLKSRSIELNQSEDAFAITMAHNLATVIGESIGNGFTELGKSILAKNSSKIANYEKAKERIKSITKKLKKEIKDDW